MKFQITPRDLVVADTDYSKDEVSRDAAEKFPLVGRGSVRLVRGLYRTEAEQRAYEAAGLALKLPRREQLSWVGRMWRRIAR